MKLVIDGIPRTKKNHTRRIKRGRRVFSVQSEAHEAWAGPAVLQLRFQAARARAMERLMDTLKAVLPDEPVNMRAIVYRDRRVGDLLNYLAAVSDVLEQAGVVDNDRLIVTVDGSRLRVDKRRPRVEIELTPARADAGP